MYTRKKDDNLNTMPSQPVAKAEKLLTDIKHCYVQQYICYVGNQQ